MIQLMLVEDHHLVRSGFQLILESQEDMAVLADVESGAMALDFLTRNQVPDLILTDVKMGEMDGISLIQRIKEKYPQIKILALSMLKDILTVSDVLNAGGDGYLVKDSSADEALFGIRQIANGEKYLSVSLGISCVENYRHYTSNTPDKGYILAKYDISERELAVLEMISEGLTNAEIADRIFLSKRTVEGHRKRLIEKTHTRNTAGLVRFGFQNMLLH
ncbi:response regulator transcription factor [Sphingobacterium prati]|uniref:response regulator transcription factor n=1 Tax=Sphingobacterium prati TaxID=2737006 RepID=UPI00155644F2|nr:response regulator transcription factor [Sphingobacterium prati]NPE45013.1 response regulator transcription factor [Sphingobacterium prati]